MIEKITERFVISGVMLNEEGMRFVDEGINFRNYTYAQFGRTVLQQSGIGRGRYSIVSIRITVRRISILRCKI